MEPLEWTGDGWFRVPASIDVAKPIEKPIASEKQPDRRERLGEFRVGLDWKFYKAFDPERFSVKDGVLTLRAQGTSPGTSSPIMMVAGNHAYQIEVEIEKVPGTTAGITLYYNSNFNAGVGFSSTQRLRIRHNASSGRGRHDNVEHMWLRLRNDNQVITAQYSYDGKTWHNEEWGLELSGYNHNTLHEFQSLLPGLFATGEGDVKFSNFKYTIL